MTESNHSVENTLKIVWPVIFLGVAIGFFLSWLVLSGDEQGRVNLLYLLLVYLFIPLLSILISLFSLIFGKGINLVKLISTLPIWTFQIKALIRKIHQLRLDKSWFLLQSQAAAIAYSVTSLFIYFILILATDLNFVWRSTILTPADIYPLLKIVAWPWSFWDGAQPSLELLEMTRDSRLVATNNHMADYSVWWKFILATQVFYSLLLRIMLIIWIRNWIKGSIKSDIEQTLQQQILNSNTIDNETVAVVEITDHIHELVAISNWDGIDDEILQLIPHLELATRKIFVRGLQDRIDIEQSTKGSKKAQLLIVKAWEPPMGELQDFMKLGKGYLLPIDWDDNGLKKLELHHLQEWQRFINQLKNWQLYITEELQLT